MKIAVASNNQQTVSGHVGKCRGFLIYEIENNSILNKNYLENTFTHHRMNQGEDHHHEHNHAEGHGHGHQNLMDALKGCEALIFQSGGWRMIEDLKVNNIKPVLTDEKFSDDAVTKYLKGELLEKEDGACHAH